LLSFFRIKDFIISNPIRINKSIMDDKVIKKSITSFEKHI
jgi:hypothetical protein